jgi:thymidylate synthase/NTP pyrophosphatase (non-canonical NTP hydrolase)
MQFREFQEKLLIFANERHSKKKHTPKNISMALAVEAAELLEIFQWLDNENSRSLDTIQIKSVQNEIADILIYSFHLANELNLDMEKLLLDKFDVVQKKFLSSAITQTTNKPNLMEPLIICSPNLFDAYKQSIMAFYKFNLSVYQSRTAVIYIENAEEHNMPMALNSKYNEYYQCFTSPELDSRWKYQSDWYLSYARRVTFNDVRENILDRQILPLIENKNSRECVLSTYNAQQIEHKPSLTSIWFSIKENALDMQVNWRSRELFIAFPINTLAMFSLMRVVIQKLRKVYPNLVYGQYTEFINSLHAYPSFYIQNLQQTSTPPDLGRMCDEHSDEYIRTIWSIMLSSKETEYDTAHRKLALQNLR